MLTFLLFIFLFSIGRLLAQLTDMIDDYVHFEIDDQSGKPLSSLDMTATRNTRF